MNNMLFVASVTRTFYVIRQKSSGLFHVFTENEGRGGFSSSAKTIDGSVTGILRRAAQQFPSFSAVVSRFAKNTFKPENYEIVRVDRTTTAGKTTRRIVKYGETIQAGDKFALINPLTGNIDSYSMDSLSVFVGNTFSFGLSNATLYARPQDALTAIVKDAIAKGSSSMFNNQCGVAQIVRVREESTEPTVSDTLTVLQ